MSRLACIISQIVLAAWGRIGDKNILAVGTRLGPNHALSFVFSGGNIGIGILCL